LISPGLFLWETREKFERSRRRQSGPLPGFRRRHVADHPDEAVRVEENGIDAAGNQKLGEIGGIAGYVWRISP
jgi:hypothetical protein